MSLTAMEWTLCLLAVSSLSAVNAGAVKQEERLSCSRSGCRHGGTCVVEGDVSWCKCTKFFSGLDCGIGHTAPRQYNDVAHKRWYRGFVIFTACVLALGVILVAFLFSMQFPTIAAAYGRWRRALATKIHPAHPHACNVTSTA